MTANTSSSSTPKGELKKKVESITDTDKNGSEKRRRQRVARPVSSSLIRVTIGQEEGPMVLHRNLDGTNKVTPRDLKSDYIPSKAQGSLKDSLSQGPEEDPSGQNEVQTKTNFIIYPHARLDSTQAENKRKNNDSSHSPKQYPHSPACVIANAREKGKNTYKKQSPKEKKKHKSTVLTQQVSQKHIPLEVLSGTPIRLNKFLANSGVCSRRTADQYIFTGRVSVNGEIITEYGTQVYPTDQVLVDGKEISLESKVYILLNKPKNCVTTASDPEGRRTVMDLVSKACTERLHPVGRLDRNTTGVLLLTNDGDLSVRLMHPSFRRKKIYQVCLDKPVSIEHMRQIAEGFELEDGEIHADAISYIANEEHNHIGIEIHSGRNRIVRRIFEHFGYRVVALDRVYYAGLTKKDLPRGRWRYLTEEELCHLRMGIKEEEEASGANPLTKVYKSASEEPLLAEQDNLLLE